MKKIERRVRLEFEHSIHFTDGLFDLANPLLKETLLACPARQTPKVERQWGRV